MEVLHAHCAGLDIHKDSVVGCVRHMVDGKITTRVKTLQDNNPRADGLVGLAFDRRRDAYRDGSDGCVLEAGLAHPV